MQLAKIRQLVRTARGMGAVGDLVRSTEGAWIARPPTHCPNGHTLGPHRCLVGFAHCSHAGGHTTWWCRECGATVFGPPLGAGALGKEPNLTEGKWKLAFAQCGLVLDVLGRDALREVRDGTQTLNAAYETAQQKKQEAESRARCRTQPKPKPKPKPRRSSKLTPPTLPPKFADIPVTAVTGML